MKNSVMIIISILILVSVSVIAICCVPKSSPKIIIREVGGSQCGKDCKGLDPILDPLYNVKQVIENTLLLESHLVNERQSCIQCQYKHILLCTGLLAEAVWLAGKNVELYPHLADDLVFYNNIFYKWVETEDKHSIRLQLAEKLRQKRKELVHDYFTKSKELQEKLRKANVSYT